MKNLTPIYAIVTVSGLMISAGYGMWQFTKPKIEEYISRRDCAAFLTTIEGSKAFSEASRMAGKTEETVEIQIPGGRKCVFETALNNR